MKPIVLPLLLLSIAPVFAQELTLDSCIALATRHERYDDSRAQVAGITDLQDDEVRSGWYPQLTLNAQSTIQNEQIELPFNVPGVQAPEIPLDFHRVLLNFSQTVYDGQVTRARLRIEQLNVGQQDLALATRELELRGQVTQRYMAVLLAEAQQRLLELRHNTIDEQHDRIVAAAEAGAALASEAAGLEAELLTVEQDALQLRFTIVRLRNELAVLTGEGSVAQAALLVPSDADPGDGTPEQRPDIRAFDLRLQALDAQSDLAHGSRMPKVKIFGNAGAGDPGYNTFQDEWRPMLLIGAGLEWRIFDWGTRKRTDRLLDLQRSLLQSDRDRLTEQWTIAIAQQRQNLQQFHELITTDDRLVELRSQVAHVKAEQLANGTITASEYITELDKEHAARLGQEIHRLQAVLAVRTSHDIQAR